MFKTPRSSKNHGDAMFIARINNFPVSDGAARLHNRVDSRIFNCVNTVPKGEEGIRCQYAHLIIFKVETSKLCIPFPDPLIWLNLRESNLSFR